jgi:intraflagellar transport protein 80
LSQTALLTGDLLAAEGILLQNGLTNEAIKLNIELYNWNRALELAIKHKKLLREVLDLRKRYLEILDKKEVNQTFLTVQTNIMKNQLAKKVFLVKKTLDFSFL